MKDDTASKISGDLKKALMGGDLLRVSVLRFLLSSIKNKEIELRGVRSLTEEDINSVIGKQIKTREESVEAFEKGSRPGLAAKEREEISILKEYQPEQMPEEQVRAETVRILENIPQKDFGSAMKAVMGQLKGKADGALISRIVKDFLGTTP